jgi:UDP-glucose 4-epimerase
MKVLVTGGAGFIGSHLAERLLQRGDRVVALDDLSTGRREHVPAGAELAVVDVADRGAVADVVAGAGFDALLHVAGQASISRSFEAPERDLRVNVDGTLSVLDACVAARIPRLLFASSMTVYGEPDALPTPEDAPCIPVSNYGVTKYAAERYVQIAGARADVDLDVTSLRMFNVYGERQSLTNPYQGVLAIFVGNALRGEPLTIRSDGEQARDFVYVGDVADAWLAVLDEPATHGRVLNVGSGRDTTIRELAASVLAGFDSSLAEWEIHREPAQVGDLRASRADISALTDATGWSPRTDLADGMARTIAWARGDR